MKYYRLIPVLFLILLIPLSSHLFGQEMSAFELIDNLSVGLTPAPSSKWGVAIADIDGNGWPDIYQARSASPGYSRIYINNGGIFTDITDQSPLKQIEDGTNETQTKTAVWVDYDNDGDKDLYFGTDKKMHLLRNDDNTFVDVAQSLGLVGGVPGFVVEYEYANGAWGDFDQDGDLDVLVAQHNNVKPYIFRNDNGTFADIQSELGLELDIGYNSYGVQWIDFDLDGDLDLSARKWIFRNDDGVFTEIAASLSFTPGDAQNATWFDYDIDGDLDYFHSVSSAGDPGSCSLWENQGDSFVDVSTEIIGIPLKDRFRGLSVGDFDNDGDEDIFLNINEETFDMLLLNDEVSPGSRALYDVAQFVGITTTGDRKCGSFFDYDRDGFLDLYLPSAQHSHILYRNVTNTNNWVGFILEGSESNRDAVGTLVRLVAGELSQIRFTRIPTDYLNQDNPWVHFGIGKAESIDSVIIHWPSGAEEILTDIAINEYHNISEGQAIGVDTPENAPLAPESWRLEQNFPNPFNASTKINYHLSKDTFVRLEVYNLNGRKMVTLVNEPQSAGSHDVVWNGTREDGRTLASGEYFCRIRTNDFTQVIKMILLQ